MSRASKPILISNETRCSPLPLLLPTSTMHPTSDTMAVAIHKIVDKHDDPLGNNDPSGSTENMAQNNDPMNLQYTIQRLVRILYIAIANHNAPYTGISDSQDGFIGIMDHRHVSQIELVSSHDTLQARHKQLLDARVQIATMTKEQRDLE
jgi:hypothetical protein